MECFRVKVPEGARLTGYTASGGRAPIVPGEYLVHKLARGGHAPALGDSLRFVGADHRGRDVHVPLRSVPPEIDILTRVKVEPLS
jgi:hypothetical protein